MIFKKKRQKRLYYPTKSTWYRKLRKRPKIKSSNKIFSHNIRIHFTRFLKNFFLYVVIAAFFLFSLIFVLFSSHFSVNKIEIVRDDLHVDSASVSHLLNQFNGKSIFLFPKKRVVDLIQKNYPEFSGVRVKKVLPNIIKVELEVYDIVANIKAYYVLPKVTIPPLDSEDVSEDVHKISDALKTAFTLDEDARVSEKEDITPIEQRALINRVGQAIFDREEDLELMTIVIDNLFQPIEDREVVISKETMDYLLDSIKYFTNLTQMEIKSVRYIPVGREFHLRTDNGLILWLSLMKDYKEQLDKFHTIYKVAELDKEDISYIDLRIKEKIIYCPRKSRCASNYVENF